MPRYKNRPCPGCGKLYPLAPQTICGVCAATLSRAKEHEARLAAQLADTEKVVVSLGRQWMYHSELVNMHIGQFVEGNPGDEIVSAMIAATGAEPYRNHPSTHTPFIWDRTTRIVHDKSDSYSYREAFLVISQRQADALEALGNAIQRYALGLVRAARAKEMSFMVKLAAGEATVEDYEKRVVK